MPYTTSSAMSERILFYELGSFSANAVGSAIAWGDNKINGLIGNVFTLPFTPTNPPQLESYGVMISMYQLYRTNLAQGMVISDESPILRDYKEAIEDVEKIAEGNMALLTSSLQKIENSIGDRITSNTKNYTPIFDLTDPTTQTIDKDRIKDELDDKRF